MYKMIVYTYPATGKQHVGRCLPDNVYKAREVERTTSAFRYAVKVNLKMRFKGA